jgi:hypothetical protein
MITGVHRLPVLRQGALVGVAPGRRLLPAEARGWGRGDRVCCWAFKERLADFEMRWAS